MTKVKGLLFIAHGSRNAECNLKVEKLVTTVALNKKTYQHISTAFLEFSAPTIAEAIMAQIKQGVTEITVFPFFLGAGHHVTKDIPNIIDAIKIQHPFIHIIVLPAFGTHPSVKEAIEKILFDEGRESL